MARRPQAEIANLEERAFELYLEGKSLKTIAEELGLSVNTVLAIKRRNNWEERKAEIDERLQERLDLQRVKFREKAFRELEDLRQKAYEMLNLMMEQEVKFRSLEGGINAISLLYAMESKLLGLEKPQTQINIENKNMQANIDLAVDTLFRILRKVFGPEFEAKKDELVRAIHEELS